MQRVSPEMAPPEPAAVSRPSRDPHPEPRAQGKLGSAPVEPSAVDEPPRN